MEQALVFILMVMIVGSPFVFLAMIAGVLEEKERNRSHKGTGRSK